MTALDIRKRIDHQVQRIPDDNFSLLLLLNYAKQLTDNYNVNSELTGDALRLWNRTQVLSKLYRGWDGADAAPIETKTIANMQNILQKGVETDFCGWVLFPDDNGTLLLQLQNKNASISLGNNYFSYVFQNDKRFVSGENIKFSVSSFLNVIKKINKDGE